MTKINKQELEYQIKLKQLQIAELLRHQLRKHKLTLQQFSQKSKINITTLEAIFYADCDCHLMTIAKINATITTLEFEAVEKVIENETISVSSNKTTN